jgi:hypothetical protein
VTGIKQVNEALIEHLASITDRIIRDWFRGSTVEAKGFKTVRNAGNPTFASQVAYSQLTH